MKFLILNIVLYEIIKFYSYNISMKVCSVLWWKIERHDMLCGTQEY